jgi:DNA-binding CsgD family transcriptional regulator
MAILTTRQREILALAAEGLQYAEIAKRLWVSESTVKTTLRDARKRLGARDTANAVLLAMRAGELS